MDRSTRGYIRWAALAITLALVALSEPSFAATGSGTTGSSSAPRPFAPKIVVRAVKTGLNGPAGFTFAPDGQIFFLERGTGYVRTYSVKTKKSGTVFHITGVDGSGERGALGIALNPQWPAKPYIYVYVTRHSKPGAPLQNQLVRIRVVNMKGTGLRVLFTQPVSSATNHNGGRILFGPNGALYVFIGENANPANAQNLANLRGKMLRVNAVGNKSDGTAFAGNFHGRIFSYGMRNSFGFTFDSSTNRLWETENGPECNDEINVVHNARNYGWGPSESCPNTNNSGPNPRIMPARSFASTLGITGDAFCYNCGLGAGNEGRLFFGCVNDGVLRSVKLNAARTDITGATNSILTAPSGAIYSMEVAPNGRIYFSNNNGIYRLVLG
jgi:glucose/arabinose dehydrogenase